MHLCVLFVIAMLTILKLRLVLPELCFTRTVLCVSVNFFPFIAQGFLEDACNNALGNAQFMDTV